MLLKASRPQALPPSPTDLEGTSEGPTGTRPGKGRGGQPTGAGRGFATPPSHWKSSEPSSAAPLEGNRTEGRMPTTGEHALKSMGKVPGEVTDKSPGDLQRALEAEIVDHLRTQNAQLMEELDRLRSLQSQQSSASNSNSSWVEVGKEPSTTNLGMNKVQFEKKECSGRVGYHTPRSSGPTGGDKLDRFTPNGTQVPKGTPPEDDAQHVPRPPPELPAVPPMPSSFMDDANDMKRFLDGYETVEMKSKVFENRKVMGACQRTDPA